MAKRIMRGRRDARARERGAPGRRALPDEAPAAGVARLSVAERLARALTDLTGSTAAFVLALACVAGWAATGPVFRYSANWQLVVNTATTIVTFLMVFLIQRAQNKDSLAIHLKLDELVAAQRGASNRLVSAEELPEEDLAVLRGQYRQLMQDAAQDEDGQCARSIDDDRAAAPPASSSKRARQRPGKRARRAGP